jgi:MYXO-CTERM domain-containing protein
MGRSVGDDLTSPSIVRAKLGSNLEIVFSRGQIRYLEIVPEMRFAKGKEKRLSGQPLPLLPLETSDTIPNPRQSSPIAMGRLLPAPAGCMTSTCDAAAAPGLGGKDVLFLAAGIFLLWVLRRRFWFGPRPLPHLPTLTSPVGPVRFHALLGHGSPPS